MQAADIETEIISAMAADDWELVHVLSLKLDALRGQPPRRPSLAKSALWYARQGLPVFPLQPRSKLPYKGSHGFEDATTQPARIIRHWQNSPQSNIGIATGHLVDVVDIDRTEGVLSWLNSNLPKPDEPIWSEVLGVVWTPRARLAENLELAKGGMHLYFASVAGQGNRAGIMPGIDYRGRGGYVAAPPSLNVEGTPYRWRSAPRFPPTGA